MEKLMVENHLFVSLSAESYSTHVFPMRFALKPDLDLGEIEKV